MRWFFVLTLWFAAMLPVHGQGKVKLYTPADASYAAAADALALYGKIGDELHNVRYLSIANIPAEQRKVYAETIAFLLNSLSRERDIINPVTVGEGGIVLRLNLADYGMSHEAWDKQGDADFYFHERLLASNVRISQTVKKVVKIWPGGVVANGEYWPPGTPYYPKENVVEQTQYRENETKKVAIASWLDPASSVHLVKLLQTRTPILRGDWFLANASLPPFYYDLLGLKTLDDAKDLALFDKRAEKLTQVKATVVISGGQARKVARNNRIMFRINTAGSQPGQRGYWWQTLDFNTSVGKQNVITNFLTDDFDGGEIIFTLPNGLQGYFLINGQRKRVDEVPIAIAPDSMAQDHRVRNGRSCIWCHTQGIQPFQSSYKVMLDFRDPVTKERLVDFGLNVDNDLYKTADFARQLRRIFETPNFGEIVKGDNQQYGTVVKAITGRTSAANAALFLQVYDEYAELPLDAERLQYEAGISDLDVQAACKVKIEGVNDGVLIQKLLNLPIRRDQFEEHYGEFMRRVLAWQATKKGK